LWGLATHPTDPDIFATVGDDAMLRIWSIKKNNLVKSHNIGWPGRSVAWHPSGNVLAVGLHETVKGGGVKKGGKSGKQGKNKSNSKSIGR
jgi:WD40 repeat protein